MVETGNIRRAGHSRNRQSASGGHSRSRHYHYNAARSKQSSYAVRGSMLSWHPPFARICLWAPGDLPRRDLTPCWSGCGRVAIVETGSDTLHPLASTNGWMRGAIVETGPPRTHPIRLRRGSHSRSRPFSTPQLRCSRHHLCISECEHHHGAGEDLPKQSV